MIHAHFIVTDCLGHQVHFSHRGMTGSTLITNSAAPDLLHLLRSPSPWASAQHSQQQHSQAFEPFSNQIVSR